VHEQLFLFLRVFRLVVLEASVEIKELMTVVYFEGVLEVDQVNPEETVSSDQIQKARNYSNCYG
jgi:hypothetical protein